MILAVTSMSRQADLKGYKWLSVKQRIQVKKSCSPENIARNNNRARKGGGAEGGGGLYENY